METNQKAMNFWKEKDRSTTSDNSKTISPRQAAATLPTKKYLALPKRPPPPAKTDKSLASVLVSPSLLHKKLHVSKTYPHGTIDTRARGTQQHYPEAGPGGGAGRSKICTEPRGVNVSELAKALAPTLKQSTSMSAIRRSSTGKKELTKSLSQSSDRRGSAGSRRWGSLTGSVSSHSGFTCYLDGPIEDRPLRNTPSPPLPLSPLKDVCDLVRITESDTSTDDHFTPSTAWSLEMEEFWKVVEKVSQGNRGEVCERSLLLSPVLVTSQSPPTSKLYGVATFSSSKSENTITVLVHSNPTDPPVSLQCSGVTVVQSLIARALRESRGGKGSQDATVSRLKVCGREEFLHSDLGLGQHEYVKQCQKLRTDVKLVLVEKPPNRNKTMDHPLPQGGNTAAGGSCISQDEANSLLNSYYAKEQKFRSVLESHENMTLSPVSLPTLTQSVVRCVCLLCERMCFMEPPDMIDAVFNLRRSCKTATELELEESLFSPTDSSAVSLPDNDPWISIPDGSYTVQEEHVQDILQALDLLKLSVQHLVSLYCSTFTPGYSPHWVGSVGPTEDIATQHGHMRVKVAALHRIAGHKLEKFSSLQVEVCVYYGGKALSKKAFSPHAKLSRDFFECVVWDKWLNLGVEISSIPLESRVLFILHGIEIGSDHQHIRSPVAWAALRLFDHDRVLVRGSQVVGLWMEAEPDPVDSMYSDLHNRKSIILQVGFEEPDKRYQFPVTLPNRLKTSRPAPPPNVKRTIVTVGERNRFQSHTPSELAMVWSNRMFCSGILSKCPRGISTVILAAPSFGRGELGDIWAMIKEWGSVTEPTFGLELLDAQHPDMYVRSKGVEWLTKLNNDDLCDLLPQLVQSLRCDVFQVSAMTELLLKRVRSSQRVAHYLFWHLRVVMVSDSRFQERYSQLLAALELLCGNELLLQLNTQVELVSHLSSVATAVKSSRVSHRQTVLIHGLQSVADKLMGPFSLPLNPAMVARGISVETCAYFNSNTVPLRLSFLNADACGEDIEIIYKVGDDLRQDILVLQMIKLMEKLWLKAGIDLRMITYQCVATGVDEGMLELVTEASTLREIQTEHGVTGSFKDKPLSEWLMRHNPTESSYQQAVENFTLSCAGYCVATFVLGICDRHNDNIMIKKSGHMFHIDFGKILGNAQMFGSIKRDRVPFVLTRDMAYVINGGDQPTTNFQKFTDLCCAAYNELRKHSSLLLSLLSLMLSSGLPELSTTEDIQYVSDALLPGKSEPEATFTFTKYIEDSLSSLSTPVNFFIHNLAQFKFSSSENTPALLSFCPQAYSIATDGKVTNTVVLGFHKRFHPDTHYMYQIEIYRDCSAKKSVIFRRYREFNELQRKLAQYFPDENLPVLPGKIFTPGKSNTKETSETRQLKLNDYLCGVLEMDPRVSESDIVYTFLHCLIRDEQELGKLKEEEQGLSSSSLGKVKLELAYKVKQQCLSVMVRHVKDLAPRKGMETADPYVKVYLLPDLQKTTKQKTKIAKRTLNPTYNQQFVYVIPQSALSNRSIQVSVWDANRIVNKQCLCVDTIKLSDYRTQLLQGTIVSDWFEMSPFVESKTVWH